MRNHRLEYIFSGVIAGVFAGAAMSAPASAQTKPEDIIDTMIVCSQITNVSARVACYDGTVMQARAARGETGIAGAEDTGEQVEERRAPEQVTARESFGQASMPREVAPERPERLDAISASVDATREIRPGIFSVSLDDGSQWEFVEGVPSYFFPPRKGVQVSIERGAMGSFRMLIPGKSAVRVRRTR